MVTRKMVPVIPKRIIQTGRSTAQPLRVCAMMSNIRLHNPDFDYLFFDDAEVERFIDEEFPEYRPVFDGFKFKIQRYDFFRYLAVYRYGGFYFDLDVLLARGVSSLLEFGCVFSFEGLTYSRHLREKHNLDWEIGNYAFGASAGHPFLKAVIDNCVTAQKDASWVSPMMRDLPFLSKQDFLVLYTTGPGMLTRTFAERPDLAKTVKVLFPDDVCDFKNWNHFGEFGAHLMDASWRFNKGRLRNRVALHLEGRKLQKRVTESAAAGRTRTHDFAGDGTLVQVGESKSAAATQPLVSILIPAYNAEEWIAESLGSVLAQTWENKEIIVVDDGSKDRTVEVARQFENQGVRVIRQENKGAAAARNTAFSLSKGDYIQWLDADDLLAPDKISKQMELVRQGVGKRTALSGAYGIFMFRTHGTQFIPTELWCNRMSPAEWLVRKMSQNLYMQTATWLISRELTEAAGPWDTRLLGDDDGEYFCRVLMASDEVLFVPDARVFYRCFGYNTLSYLGDTRKIEAHWLSMKLHIAYLRRLEQSKRVNAACVQYLHNWLLSFYPEHTEIVNEAQQMATEMGGELGVPSLSWKYRWIKQLFGWRTAKTAQRILRKQRWAFQRRVYKLLYAFDRQPVI
jgi:glycosyltransferase involved in cell wall biosynthesis